MNNNLYLAWELASARQRDLLAWAREEQAAQTARRARRAAIRAAAAANPTSPKVATPGDEEPALPCCQGKAHRRAA